MSAHTGRHEIDAYIRQFPTDVQQLLNQIRTTVTSAVPEAEEAMKYGIPTLRMTTNLLHYAAFDKHIGLYPTPSGMQEFAAELQGYVQGKGSVQLPLDQPLPLDLIRRIALFRAATVSGSKTPATAAKQTAKRSTNRKTARTAAEKPAATGKVTGKAVKKAVKK
jgi:uncharacterized protein YdhG (YjbR/CyaY superfamily)